MKTKKTSGLKASIAAVVSSVEDVITALEERPAVEAYVEEYFSNFGEARFTAMCSKTFEVSRTHAYEYASDEAYGDLAINRCLKYLDEACPEHTHVHA
jgi:shikimate kinase